MNCVLFAKMDQVFSKENKTLKKYWKIGKNTGKVREFCHSGKVGTLSLGINKMKRQAILLTPECLRTLLVITVIKMRFTFLYHVSRPNTVFHAKINV